MKKVAVVCILILINLLTGFIVKAEVVLNSSQSSLAPNQQLSINSTLIKGPLVVCLNQSGVSYRVDSLPGMSTYNWTVPSGATITSGQGTRFIRVNFGAAVGAISVTGSNGITQTGPYTINITIAQYRPQQPVVVNGPTTTVCPGNIVTYYVPYDPVASAFVWILPLHMTVIGGAGTDSITVRVDSGFVWGYLRVAANNCRGTSGQYSIAIYSAPAKPGSVTGPQVGACPGGTYTYSFAPVPGATSYTWYAPPGSIVRSPVASGNPLTTSVTTVNITFGTNFSYGQLRICSNSGCNSSELREMYIRSLPVKPGAIAGPFYGVCGMSNILYTLDSVPGATSYTWSFSPSNTTVIHSNGDDSVYVDFLPGFNHATLCVTANDSCGSSISRCGVVFASPKIPTDLTGPNGACNTILANATAYYSVPPVFGANTYVWSVPSGAAITAGVGTERITVNYMGAASGNVSVSAVNTCGTSPAKTRAVVVNPCRISSSGEMEFIQTVNVYPNPSHGHFNIQFTSPESERYEIILRDLSGRQLRYIDRISAGENNEYLETADLSKGIYIVELRRKNIIENIRVMVD